MHRGETAATSPHGIGTDKATTERQGEAKGVHGDEKGEDQSTTPTQQ